ncbi:class I SAM-dependent methyltransferase [Geomesophilobacter sediminis]|uniref:Methyltransferase domain-containing protein n=1 Tax=Geomesophilobacter sediminis TaxID=2798584 RepID=A0A8J7LW14_9BACT|nr:methyltransferase [Geomesophilobacter sediminis]MBJ6726209.1 methyltransferase domain-containing protein [Geomesophilobacter sediminis]
MPATVRQHYELYPYPSYPLLASVRRCDTYALNLSALWARFNGELPAGPARRMLIAGCGSFSPYPFALANAGTPITALDLSQRSLRRARLHCLLHRLSSVEFVPGDLLDQTVAPGPYGFIDAYGVLHHLEHPEVGLRALAARLTEGGILRVMVYSRYARSEEESIRRALRLLKIDRPEQVRDLVRRSKPGSRLRRFFDASDEMSFRAGIADALLHPCVQTYRIEPFLELVRSSGLEPLLFAHPGALAEVNQEVERIRELETRRSAPGNFVVYLGKGVHGPCPEGTAVFTLNPCLGQAVSFFRRGPVRIAGRLGSPNPPLDREERCFLRRFRKGVPATELSGTDLERADRYAERLFLLRHRPL